MKDVDYLDALVPSCQFQEGMKDPLKFCTVTNNGGTRACAAPVGNSAPWVCGIDTNIQDQKIQESYCNHLGLTLCSTRTPWDKPEQPGGFWYATQHA